MIWHYTSMDLLDEFLKPGAKLFASHFAYMNDTQDCRIATKVLARVMASRLQWWHGSIQLPDPEVMFHEIERGLFMPRFIACFSRSVDDLSQWRGYAPVRGVSLGFDEEALRSAIGMSKRYPARISLGDCIYKSEQELAAELLEAERETKAILSQKMGALDLCFNVASCDETQESSSLRKDKRAELIAHYEEKWSKSLLKANESVFWKHHAFVLEKEVRLAMIFDGPQPIRDIELVGGIPRVVVPLTRPLNSLIRRILIGPGYRAEGDVLTAQTLAFKYHLNIKIDRSNIPYRSKS